MKTYESENAPHLIGGISWLDMSAINNIVILQTYRISGLRRVVGGSGMIVIFSQTKRQCLVMYSRPNMRSAFEHLRQDLARVDIFPTPSIKAFDFCK